MKRLAVLLTFLVVFVAKLDAQLPPLIDREIFFGNPEIVGAQISPDGKYVSFIKPYNGVRNIWVKEKDEPFDKARVITSETKRPITSYFWSLDSKYILFVKDNDGDENFNVYAVNPAEAAEGKIPVARNLTKAEKARAIIIHLPKSERDAIYVALNDRDPAWHDLYKIKISTGDKTLISENKNRITGWLFDNNDRLRMALRNTEKGDTEILAIQTDGSLKKIYSCNVFESCSALAFHKDNKRLYVITNRGDDVNLARLSLLDLETGKEELVEQDPLNRVDIGSVGISNKTKEIISITYFDDKPRVYFKDKGFEEDYKLLKKYFGDDKAISFVSMTEDEDLMIVNAYSDTEPGITALFDRKTKKVTPLYRIRERLPREALAPMKVIRYKSSDGLEIPAYLTLPKGVEPRKLPLVVVPHGGPWARDVWGYNSIAQFLANRGYAVLQPNFRGSTGYGKKFLNAGNKQWGDLMQDDITWGVKYLIEEGIADPKRVGIMGGSYGGYATLAGVTFTPDLYAAAVAFVAPSNLITLLETIPPYWAAVKTIFLERVGDPSTPEGRAQLIRQSPLTHVDKIKTPLLIAHGANDPRVKKSEADQIVVALRERGYPVEYIVAPDEGHGFLRPVNSMALYARAEEFLAKYLGGRYQQGGPPEVMQRLKEITVDIKTVTMPKTVDITKPADVNATGKWLVTLDAMGQTLSVTLEINQKDSRFDAVISSAVGSGRLDNGKVSGKNLKGNLKVELQGQTLDFEFDAFIDESGKIQGTLSAPGLPPLSFTGKREN
ncbi:MAG: S9 family peptidase [Pyrinomonadaceae bacterium]|nr:S9 family peptidase [Pyrinomonadaceae bacterium]MCX7638884.1 S9 family peptidase [Pyrinomonadaceae bacterium]MDW8304979.1 S9 family peptidase [Acidobacteriota bacterium]